MHRVGGRGDGLCGRGPSDAQLVQQWRTTGFCRNGTSDGVGLSGGSPIGSLPSAPAAYPNQGGLCTPSVSSNGDCPAVFVTTQTVPQTGQPLQPFVGLGGTPGLIPIQMQQLPNGDSNIKLVITVSDAKTHLSSTASYYEVTLGNGQYLGCEPAAAACAAGVKDAAILSFNINDGMEPLPPVIYLDVTNGYLANNAIGSAGYYTNDVMTVTVQEYDVPEPTSIALLTGGIGLLGLLRRQRAVV